MPRCVDAAEASVIVRRSIRAGTVARKSPAAHKSSKQHRMAYALQFIPSMTGWSFWKA
jgi:hypothetical protein